MLTAGGDNSSRTFSGVLQNGAGTLALTKAGTGALVFSGSNSYNGGTTITAGTLQLGDGAVNNGSVQGNVNDSSVLVFANPLPQTYTGQISGSGSVTKTAAGTLTLATSNGYTATLVSGGTLLLANAGAISASTFDTSGAGSLSSARSAAPPWAGCRDPAT